MTVELPVDSKTDATTDVGAIWKEAIDRYGEITVTRKHTGMHRQLWRHCLIAI